jgi:hypothetical protein
VFVKWRIGIVEGCGRRVLTGVFGCEGEEVTRERTELFIEGRLYCSAGTEMCNIDWECRIHEWRKYVWKTLAVKGEVKIA